MADQKPYTPEKLVIGILISRIELLDEVRHKLEAAFGETDYESEPSLFTFSQYYDKEMGTPIWKVFWSHRPMVEPSRLPEIKIQTNSIEGLFGEHNKRRVNIDPGLLALSRFVLATTKEGSHRIPLRDGIFGEVTLQFAGGDFRDQPWTYPDFRSEPYKAVLREIREIYKKQLGNYENPRRQSNR